MRPIGMGMLVLGAALLVYSVMDLRSGYDFFSGRFTGYYYKTPAKIGAALGAGLVVGALLLRRRNKR